MKARLALIGCGGIGSYHLSHFMNYGDIIDMVGFCDLVLERAEDFCKKAGSGEAFTDYKEMYDKVKPDIVFICIPPYCHGEIERETINRGIHFFVEKPLALDMKLGTEICELAEKAGIITGVGFQCRYSNLVEPHMEFAKNNDIMFMSCERMGGIPSQEWWKDKKLSGGQLVEQTVHQCDIIRYILGEPKTVFSMNMTGKIKNAPDGYDTDDLSVTTIRFESGILGTVSTGCYVQKGEAYDSKMVISSPTSRCELRLLSTLKIYQPEEEKPKDGDGFVIKGDGGVSSGVKQATVYRQDGDAGLICDRTYIEAVINKTPENVRSPYRDALKTIAFVLACNKSMETGKAVDISEMYEV